jgi:hypothetical protein
MLFRDHATGLLRAVQVTARTSVHAREGAGGRAPCSRAAGACVWMRALSVRARVLPLERVLTLRSCARESEPSFLFRTCPQPAQGPALLQDGPLRNSPPGPAQRPAAGGAGRSGEVASAPPHVRPGLTPAPCGRRAPDRKRFELGVRLGGAE